MSLAPPATVEKLQAALHAKAKRAPTYRFDALDDKVYRAEVLLYAYLRTDNASLTLEGRSTATLLPL